MTVLDARICSVCEKEYVPKNEKSRRCKDCSFGRRGYKTGFCIVCTKNEISGFGVTCVDCTPTEITMRSLHNRINNFVGIALHIGLIPDPKLFFCVDCGKQAYCWEHRDYNKPFDVEPTCKSCDVRRGKGKTLSVQGFLDTSRFHTIPIKKGK